MQGIVDGNMIERARYCKCNLTKEEELAIEDIIKLY